MDKMNLFGKDNEKKESVLMEANGTEVANTPKAPIQDETGIIRFKQVDVVSPSYNMQLDNDKVYTVDINSLESRDNCVKQLKEDTGLNFAWRREDEGKNTEFCTIQKCIMLIKQDTLATMSAIL